MNKQKKQTAIIIGAGSAGLTAAYELLKNTSIKPIILEATADIGGISKTVNYKGNRIDIGGHRFFSKSERVNAWWHEMMPMQSAPARDELALGTKPIEIDPKGVDPEEKDEVMLLRRRISRIFYLRKFFDYPISLSVQTVSNLGIFRTIQIGFSYLAARIRPIRKESSLEDFLINRFGKKLYATFFRDYTEKVWGVPCSEIPAEWGAQRIKGLSITKAILHALRHWIPTRSKKVETSLIEQFAYPKFGPGQLWETVAERIVKMGGEIHFHQKVVEIAPSSEKQIASVLVEDTQHGTRETISADWFFSTMPVRDLIAGFPEKTVPPSVREVAAGLPYRDFMTVGLLVKHLAIKNQTQISTLNQLIPDHWVYLQEPDVTAGRLQIFNNWSPYMVADPNTVWMGLEYFCNEGDALWTMSDEKLIELSICDMEKIGLLNQNDVLDSVRIRMPKAYPAYFGTYNRFEEVRTFLDRFENLYPLGRNGMHRYNNADHSMLTAMMAVEHLRDGKTDKSAIWSINTEEEYHESTSADSGEKR